MRIRIFVLTALLLTILASMTQVQADAGFVLIVNNANPMTELRASEVSALFLKKQSKWSNGTSVAPVDQGLASSVRKAFSESVLGRSAQAVDTYWRQQIFAGKGVPPPQQSSDAGVVAFVASNPGGVGYVAPSTDVSRVKVVAIK